MTTSWHTYPKLYALGHSAIKLLTLDEVIVEEKVDGSQFSFGKFNGAIRLKSRNVEFTVDTANDVFKKAANVVESIADLLVDGWTYRGEFLASPKHNALAYNRIPKNHVIIFDINTGEEAYLSYDEKKAEAERLGFEAVPLIYKGMIADYSAFQAMLDRESVLGGKKIEGVVIKNYTRFGTDKKVLMGKYVSEAFKEVHRKVWKQDAPSQSDQLMGIIGQYRSKARWDKSIQHLRDRGELTDSPADIAKIIKEIQADVVAECAPEIKDQLFDFATKRLNKEVIRGFPEWYKDKLAQQQFTEVAQ